VSSEGRISRDELFIGVARLFGRRSTCPRANVGCIAVLDGRIVASGYVGAPSGQPHCDFAGCEISDGGCIRTVHAEANVVAFAARVGTPIKGTTVYCTHAPCRKCAQLLVNAAVKDFVFSETYRDPSGLNLLITLGVGVRQYAP
jgi:dCMP deaminase